MSRFVRKKQHNRRTPLLICGFVVVLILFMSAVGWTGREAASSARDTLERAVSQDVVYCYAVEGSYPESVEYMEKNYGLTYDKDRFYIGYRLQGDNIKPEVTIIELEG